MKIKFASLAVLLIIIFATPLVAADNEIGRYQAVVMPVKDFGFFILDTKEGHIWFYARNKIIYKGKVKPGQKMGDIIEER